METKSTVVLDPGHGGAENDLASSRNNAAGPNGLLEKDLTLDIARRVAAALDGRFAVTLTRTGDTNSSLIERAAVAKAHDADVFVSIHLNGWRDDSLDGSEAFVATASNGGSRALARSVLDRVVAVTRAPDRGVTEADLGVLLPGRQGPHTAATLVELAFLTNPDEAERLAHDGYRQALAQAIADGIGGQHGALAQSLAGVPPQRIDGIDCFSGDAIVGWPGLRIDQIRFAILKASEGTGVVDAAYNGPDDRRYNGARAAYFPVGAYHYCRASGAVADAADLYLAQANNMVGVVRRLLPGDLPPAMDFEEEHNTKVVPWRGIAWLNPIQAFLDRLETALGRVPMVYTSQVVWSDYISTPLTADPTADRQAFAWLAGYPLWVKHWLGAAGNPDDRYTRRMVRNPTLPDPWSDWALWQYTGSEKGVVSTPSQYNQLNSVNHDMDASVSNGGIHVVRGLADLGRPATHGDTPRFVASADEDGAIRLLTLRDSWNETNLTTALPAGPSATGDVAACIVGSRQFIAFRERSNTHLFELERDIATEAWTLTDISVTNITATQLGEPAAMPACDPVYAVSGDQRFIAYWGVDDHQYLLSMGNDGVWHPVDVTAATGIDTATGLAACYVDGSTCHVVSRAGHDGDLFDAWDAGDHWERTNVCASSGGPAATYQPTAYVDADGNTSIVYRALHGELYIVDHRLTGTRLSVQAGGAVPCAGNPAAFVLDGRPHVVYRSADGLLREVYQDAAGWHHGDLPCPDRAAADPSVSVGTDGGSPAAFVVYRNRDGAFREAVFKAGAWTCRPVDPEPAAVGQALAVVAAQDRVDGVHPSEHNPGNPNAADMISDGILFAIHRATHGPVVDPYYAGGSAWRYDDARAHHMIVGAYHYAQAHDPGGLAYFDTQAGNLIGVLKRLLPGDLPPTFDFEEQDCAADVTWEGRQWLAPMAAFLDRVETELGRVPMIYTQQSVWHDHIETVANAANADNAAFSYFADYPLWVIDIVDTKPNRFAGRAASPQRLPKPWADAGSDRWAIWQYSDDFTPGEFTNLVAAEPKSDMDVSNGGIHVLRGLADLGRPAPYGSGDRFVAYAQENGELFVRSLQAGHWHDDSLNRFAGESDPTACVDAGKQYVAYIDRADGHLYELERSASGPIDLTTNAARPVGHFEYVVEVPDRYLAYWGEDDHVYLLVNRNGAWQQPIDVTDGAGLAAASGSPLAYVSGGLVHVVARTSDNAGKGHLWDTWFDGDEWKKRDLTGDSGAPPSTYRHASYTDAAGNTCFVFRAAPETRADGTKLRGQIHQITSDVRDVNLSDRAGAPTCAGSPVVFVLDGVLHVVYRRPDGTLQEIYGDGQAWQTRGLACAVRAAADPAIFVDPFGGPRTPVIYAVYRGRDGALYESKLEADTWTCTPQS